MLTFTGQLAHIIPLPIGLKQATVNELSQKISGNIITAIAINRDARFKIVNAGSAC